MQAKAHDWPLDILEPRIWHRRRIRPDERELARVADLLKGAERTVLVAGGGVHDPDAADALRAFAEAHAISVVERHARTSALRWDHPLNLGAIGHIGTAPANAACAAAHAASIGATAVRVEGIAGLKKVLARLHGMKGPYVIVIDTDPYPPTPHGGAWRDVGGPEVPGRAEVRAARVEHERKEAAQRADG